MKLDLALLAGGSQKKREAVVRKESTGKQDYESFQWNDMNVDMDENTEDLSFTPSAVRPDGMSPISCVMPQTCAGTVTIWGKAKERSRS